MNWSIAVLLLAGIPLIIGGLLLLMDSERKSSKLMAQMQSETIVQGKKSRQTGTANKKAHA